LQEEEFQYLVVQDDESAKEECKERDWCTEQHEGNHKKKKCCIGDENDAMLHVMMDDDDDDTRTHHEYKHTTTTNNSKKKKKALVIENNGTKVYQWNAACSSPNRNSAPIVISNDNKAVFHYEVVMHQDKYSCLNACPTAVEASGYV
jgi:hypothetical protein